MSDFDSIRESRYNNRQERETLARQELIDCHADNWMTAVTKSVENSNGTFKYVTDYEAVGKMDFADFTKMLYPNRPANSVDVFVDELHSKNFMERAAQILIDLHQSGKRGDIEQLFQDMSANYAEYQYESNIKE